MAKKKLPAAGEESVLGDLEGLWRSMASCGLGGGGGGALSCSSAVAEPAPLLQKAGCGVPGDLGGGRILSVMRGLFEDGLRGLFCGPGEALNLGLGTN